VSYAIPYASLGAVTVYRTGPGGTLVPDTGSWWDHNKTWIVLGGATIGVLGLLVAVNYAKYQLATSSPEGQAAVVGLALAGI